MKIDYKTKISVKFANGNSMAFLCLFKAKDIKAPYTLIAQLRFQPIVVNSRLFCVPWSVKIVVHF